MGAQADKIPVLVIAGPTCAGKSHLAILIAQALGGEIISADSAQVYRGLDIGTAKTRPAEMGGVPHHLLDVADPRDSFSVATYQTLADQAIADIWARGHLPILVGGTGLWIRAVLQEYPFPPEDAVHPYRTILQQQAQQVGWTALRRQLRVVDPVSYHKIHPEDHRRLVRALEVWREWGRRLPRNSGGSRYQISYWALTHPVGILHARIHRRVETMLAQGLIAEVGALLQSGVSPAAQSLTAIGYREVVAWYQGRLSNQELPHLIQRHTEFYAKRQITWFRSEKSAHWLDLSAWHEAEAVDQIVSHTRKTFNLPS